MLHLIPPRIHRALYRLAHRLRRVWWRMAKPRRRSVYVVAFDQRGRVLLVRHSYGPPVWTFPGGGLGRAEDPEDAARREFREELGCELKAVLAVDLTTQPDGGTRDEMHVFTASLAGEPVPDMREIVAVEYFAPDALPRNVDRRVGGRIREAIARRSEQGS